MGIDVGQEQEYAGAAQPHRGATPAAAIWSFGIVPDPFAPPGRPRSLDRRIPVDDLLKPGTIEWIETASTSSTAQIERAKRAKDQPNRGRTKAPRLDAAIAAQSDRARSSLAPSHEASARQADDLKAEAAAGRSAGKADEADGCVARVAELNSPPIPSR